MIFGSQRFSTLATINKGNVKKSQARLSRSRSAATSGNENLVGTPPGRGRVHVHGRRLGAWSTRSTCAPAHAAPSSGRWTRARRRSSANRGVALWGDPGGLGHRPGRPASSRPTRRPARSSGTGTCTIRPDMTLNAAPLALKDAVIVGASGGDQGVTQLGRGARSQDRRGQVEDLFGAGARRAPAARPGRTRTMPGRPAAAPSTSPGSYDPDTNITYWGGRQSVAEIRFIVSAGRQSLHQQRALAIDAATGKDSVVPPVHAQRHDGLRRDRHPHPHRHQGERRGSQGPWRHAGRKRLPLHVRPPQTASSSRPPNTSTS